MSLFLEKKMSVPEIFIPPDISLQECVKSEKSMVGCAKFFLNIIKKSGDAVSKNQMLKFDANAADFGCEKQMLILLNLFQSPVKDESQELSKLAKEILIEISKRQNAKQKNAPEKFFEEKIVSIRISNAMAYVLRAFMLTVTKRVTEGGHFQTEISQLDSIGSEFTGIMRKKMVYFTQEKLSESSVSSIKHYVSNICTLNSEEIDVLQEIFECAIFKFKDENFKTIKYFSPSFHTIKTVFAHLRESPTPILITSRTHKKNKESLNLFFQTDHKGGFQALSQEEIEKVDRKEPLVVIDVDVDLKFDEENLRQKIEEIGLYHLVLSNVAQLPHYGQIDKDIISVFVEKFFVGDNEKWNAEEIDEALEEFEALEEAIDELENSSENSLQEDLKDLQDNEEYKIIKDKVKAFKLLKKAVEEIEEYRNLAEKIDCLIGKNPFFMVDHVYCGTLEEMISSKVSKNVKKIGGANE